MDQPQINEVLLYCLRADPGESKGGRLEGLSNSDWETIIQQSVRHGVTPLLYHRLKTFPSGINIPNHVVQRLRDIYLQSASRNMHLYHELSKTLKRLRHENIPMIALKGAHLAELVYANIALRPMSDVDLLVKRTDLTRVEETLIEIGYVPSEHHRQIAKDNCHFLYGLPDRKLFVEVHWNYLPSMYPFNIDIDGQWERSIPAILAGVEVSVLCPEDLVLYLCLHASKHLFEMGLKHLYDIFEAIRHYEKEMDWKQIQFRSEQWGAEKCIYLTLRLARELLGASVPDDLLKAIQPIDFDERFMALAKDQIFTYRYHLFDGLSSYPSIAQLWGSKRLLDKAALFLRRVLPSSKEMARMYPAPSGSIRIYFYYPVRMKDLFLRHRRRIWRLLRRDEGMRVSAEQINNVTPLQDWLMSA
jgi:hypothetical protein